MKKRRDAIVELVNSKGNVSFAQLKYAFPDVSDMTLRTDLRVLDEERRLVRVYGGARSVNVVICTDDLLGLRTGRNSDAKQVIASKATGLLHPNTTVFLDSGSTATALARIFPDGPFLIYTSGISCATELSRLENARIGLPGGMLNRYSMSACGAKSVENLRGINFDLMFLGVTSYSSDAGFCCGVEDESILKQTVLHRSSRVAVLMDSSKIGLHSTFSVCGLPDIDIVVSDGNLPSEFLNECKKYNIEVY